MLGLEDLAHAASPDLVEDGVVAQDQRLRPARIDLLGLELRQLLALDELPSKFLGILGRALGGTKFSSLPGAMTPESVKLLDELFEGDGHSLPRKSWTSPIMA